MDAKAMQYLPSGLATKSIAAGSRLPQRASPRGRASHKGHRRGVAPPTFVPRVVPVLEVSLDVGGTGCAGRDFFNTMQN